jgi:hypothetical protein
MHHRTVPLIGAFIIISACPPAEAQQRGPVTNWIQQQGRAATNWVQQRFHPQPQQGYNRTNYPGWRGNPMTRSGLNYLNQLGGGIDDGGYYRNPINSREAFGVPLNDGTWEFPMEWEHQTHNRTRSITLDVQNGYIRRQDYRLFNRR